MTTWFRWVAVRQAYTERVHLRRNRPRTGAAWTSNVDLLETFNNLYLIFTFTASVIILISETKESINVVSPLFGFVFLVDF
jgi:hypothetical protein